MTSNHFQGNDLVTGDFIGYADRSQCFEVIQDKMEIINNVTGRNYLSWFIRHIDTRLSSTPNKADNENTWQNYGYCNNYNFI